MAMDQSFEDAYGELYGEGAFSFKSNTKPDPITDSVPSSDDSSFDCNICLDSVQEPVVNQVSGIPLVQDLTSPYLYVLLWFFSEDDDEKHHISKGVHGILKPESSWKVKIVLREIYQKAFFNIRIHLYL